MSYPVEHFDYLFRVIVIGDSGVGKTNLLLRFTKNDFDLNSNATIGVDFSTKSVQIDSKLIKAQIWDTAGQDRFKSIATAFYRGSVAALLVYDITNINSFNNINKWLEDLKKYADLNVVLMLVGNKSDLEAARKVKTSSAKDFAAKNHMSFIETSALNSANVEAAFLNVIEEVYHVYCKNRKSPLDGVKIEKNLTSIQNVKIQDVTGDGEQSKCC